MVSSDTIIDDSNGYYVHTNQYSTINNIYSSDNINLPSDNGQLYNVMPHNELMNRDNLINHVGFNEFISAEYLDSDSQSVWVFIDDALPKLYWQNND